MEYESRDEYIIKKYQQDENTMIQLFVHWCINHQLDPVLLYTRAYPYQEKNEALLKAAEEAAAEPEEIEISTGTLLEILQMFGNDDLAFVVSEEIEKSKD
ncbi:hypothetical protein QWY16_01700 [Planococcus shenhongbingii]|uniref:hypothetical protein n=1 Tax=Planococcus shenhongbingii TaxID=3058398 RepID=UPI00262E7BB5|nr:hypothetical protein [Planococcus sp. N016]WKA58897.1 hypothetical protein QWY16_01700 [Planococcus sp. N016]